MRGFCQIRFFLLRGLLIIFLLTLAMPMTISLAQEMGQSGLQIGGSAEFRLKYARGDAAPLQGTGYSLGRADLLQLLSLNVRGQVAPGLSVAVDLDNRRGGNLQMLELRLEGERFQGKFGGLTVRSPNPYTAYSERLRGLEITAFYPKTQIDISAGRVQGVAAKKTFRGSSAQETILFERGAPYGPSPTEQGFRASLDGMQYYVLTDTFDSDFMEVWLRYDDQAQPEGRTLAETLLLWDLEYLPLEHGEKILLDTGQYIAVSSREELLALRLSAEDLLRAQIQALIRAFNAQHNLVGEAQRKYPFIHQSQAELIFLQDLLARHIHIAAGIDRDSKFSVLDAPVDSYLERRLYDLGQNDVKPGSLEIEVKKGDVFLPVEMELPLQFQIDYDRGMIEFDFPADFFTTYAGIRIRYDYELTMGIFNLGLAIVEGSERVFLNDVPLVRLNDYLIDYELGILSVFKVLDPEDVLRVEYEYFRGPFGRMADYKTNFYSATLGFALTDGLELNLDLAAHVDQPGSASTPELVSTMPNNHLVMGLSGTYQRNGLTLSGAFALSHNEFPLDDNEKKKAANRVTAITGMQDATGQEYVILAHNDGISAGHGHFNNYGADGGLSSNAVRGMAISSDQDCFFATANGLTILSANPGPVFVNPFDFTGNWSRFYTSAGLPSNDLTCVATTPWTVWVGTAQDGVASADLASLDVWTAHATSLPSQAISSLAYDPILDAMLIGTAKGIASAKGPFVTTELGSAPIDALYSSFTTMEGFNSFAAGKEGVYARALDSTWQPLTAAPQEAQCLFIWEQLLWVGTAAGLYTWDGSFWQLVEGTSQYSITALGTAPGYGYPGRETLWVGTGGTTSSQAEALNRIICFELLGPLEMMEHDGEKLAVSADDSSRYANTPGNEHTAIGSAGRINARYAEGTLAFYGSYEAVSPDFTRIAQANRREANIWRVGTQWAATPKVNITAEHSRTSSRPTATNSPETGKTITIANKLGSVLDLGPQIEILVGQTRIEGAQDLRNGTTLSVVGRQIVLNNRLHLSAGYERNEEESSLRPENSFCQNTLRADAKLTLDNLSLSGSYRRPVKTINPGEQQRLWGITETRFSALWTQQLGASGLRASYDQTYRDNIATGKIFATKKAELKATFPPVKDGGLIPSTLLKWEHTLPFSGQVNKSITAQASVLGNLAHFWTASGLIVKRTEYTGLDKLVWDTEIYTGFNPTSQEKLLPQFDLRWKRSTSRRPDLGIVSTDTLSSTARLRWVQSEKVSNTVSTTYTLSLSSASKKGKKHTLSLQDTLHYKLSEKCTLTGTAQARIPMGEGSLTAAAPKLQLTTGFSYRFSETWSLTTALGYYRQRAADRLDGATNSFTLDAGLKATF